MKKYTVDIHSIVYINQQCFNNSLTNLETKLDEKFNFFNDNNIIIIIKNVFHNSFYPVDDKHANDEIDSYCIYPYLSIYITIDT